MNIKKLCWKFCVIILLDKNFYEFTAIFMAINFSPIY